MQRNSARTILNRTGRHCSESSVPYFFSKLEQNLCRTSRFGFFFFFLFSSWKSLAVFWNRYFFPHPFPLSEGRKRLDVSAQSLAEGWHALPGENRRRTVILYNWRGLQSSAACNTRISCVYLLLAMGFLKLTPSSIPCLRGEFIFEEEICSWPMTNDRTQGNGMKLHQRGQFGP